MNLEMNLEMNLDKSIIYYRITKSNDKTILDGPFEKEGVKYHNGFHFTNKENIDRFIYGYYITEITIPNDAQIVQDNSNAFKGVKFLSNKIIQGKRYDLYSQYTKDNFPKIIIKNFRDGPLAFSRRKCI